MKHANKAFSSVFRVVESFLYELSGGADGNLRWNCVVQVNWKIGYCEYFMENEVTRECWYWYGRRAVLERGPASTWVRDRGAWGCQGEHQVMHTMNQGKHRATHTHKHQLSRYMRIAVFLGMGRCIVGYDAEQGPSWHSSACQHRIRV